MNHFKSIFFLLILLLLQACSTPEEQLLKATLTAHDSEKLENAQASFDFRGIHYNLTRENGNFIYVREQKDSSNNVIEDIFTNDSFARKVNGTAVTVADTMAAKYQSSINSVAYFFYLPLGLKDPAVQKEVLADVQIKGQTYQTLKVTFSQEGGGEDHDDEYRYWFNSETKTLDYFAYNYHTDGGGVRFREAVNQRFIKNVVVNDYKNYGFESFDNPLDSLPQWFAQGKIPLLSEIKNQNVTIEFIQP